MNFLVSVPNATAQAIAGIAFTALAMVLPVAARWTALALVLGVFGLAAIVAAFAGVDVMMQHAIAAASVIPLLAPLLLAMMASKAVIGLLIGR